ncbi:MAG: aroK [Phycisphaerales bacterium]|nr:aroK [Phycisphaerales bacterium]
MGIVLIGYRGSGKTSVGRLLADRRGAAFVDADVVLVARAGRSIREIFEQSGEAAFREMESEVLQDLLDRPGEVISLGGGVILREANRKRLIESGLPRVYLRAGAQTLHDRIHADPATAANRPALTHLGGGVEEIRTLLAAREPLYREVATHELDVTGLSVDEVVSRLDGMIGRG